MRSGFWLGGVLLGAALPACAAGRATPARLAAEAPCLADAAAAEGWRAALAALPPARGPDSAPAATAWARVRLVTDPAVCRQALAAYATKLAAWHERRQTAVPTQAYVFDVAALKYVVIVPGQRAGEWQLSHWFSRDWTPDPMSPVL